MTKFQPGAPGWASPPCHRPDVIDGLLAVENNPKGPSWLDLAGLLIRLRRFPAPETSSWKPGKTTCRHWGLSRWTSMHQRTRAFSWSSELPPRHGGGPAMRWAVVLIRRPRTPPEAHRSLGFQRSDFSVQGIINASHHPAPALACTRFFLRPCASAASTSAGLLSYHSAAHSTDPFVPDPPGFQPPTMSPSKQPPSTAPIHPPGPALAGDASGG